MVDAESLVLDVNVLGRPSSFATANEAAWGRAAVATACEANVRPGYEPVVSRFAVSMDFRTALRKSAGEWWDLDKLIKPTLDAMSIVFGARDWRGSPQAADDRVDRITASKRTIGSGEEPGARIRVWTIEDSDSREDRSTAGSGDRDRESGPSVVSALNAAQKRQYR